MKRTHLRGDVVQRIDRFNLGRDPELLARKYEAMRNSPFAFLRATAHLFYEDLPKHPLLRSAPPAWLCGDLHLENIGTYKGDNRLVYFDVNDFDEAALGPCTWDALRCAISILVGTEALGIDRAGRKALCRGFIDSYGDALASGKARWVERESSDGMVLALIESVRLRKRKGFLDKRTVLAGGKRSIRIDGKKALPISAERRKKVMRFMEQFAKQQPDPKFFRPIDVARRIAGLGSLGLERYVVLVRGKGSPDGNYLIDLKHQPAPANQQRLIQKQPRWGSDAERVAEVQRRCQAISPAFLHAVKIDGRPFLMKGLQPTADKILLANWGGKTRNLEHLFRTHGHVLAWAQLRSSGREGSAIADDLIGFGAPDKWRGELLELARSGAAKVFEDWAGFRA
jgi:uncharacterized protein (DUF2252 family)